MFSIRVTSYALCILFLLFPPTRAQQLPSVTAGSYPDSPMPTRRIRLGEHVLLPKVPTIKPAPPTDAAGKPMHGRVRLLVGIDVKGDVKEVKLENGDPQLGQAAADAVRQWHFEPFKINGNPTEVETWVSVKFP